MNRTEFLTALETALKRKNVTGTDEILADYNEHFFAGKAEGKSEQEIIIELGSVEVIASEYAGVPASVQQNFGNITNFYNTPTSGAPQNKTRERAKERTESADGGGRREENAEREANGGTLTDSENIAADEDKKFHIPVLSAVLGVVLGIIYASVAVAGAVTVAALGVSAIAVAVGAFAGGGYFAVVSFFVFGSVWVKFAGLFAGLSLIAFGIFAARCIPFVTRFVRLVLKTFKKIIKAVFGGIV